MDRQKMYFRFWDVVLAYAYGIYILLNSFTNTSWFRAILYAASWCLVVMTMALIMIMFGNYLCIYAPLFGGK